MAIGAASLITRRNLHHAPVKDVMSADCQALYCGMPAAEVRQIVGSTRIYPLPAVNTGNELLGALDMHDLRRAGVV